MSPMMQLLDRYLNCRYKSEFGMGPTIQLLQIFKSVKECSSFSLAEVCQELL